MVCLSPVGPLFPSLFQDPSVFSWLQIMLERLLWWRRMEHQGSLSISLSGMLYLGLLNERTFGILNVCIPHYTGRKSDLGLYLRP